jgi:hypothetical protein
VPDTTLTLTEEEAGALAEVLDQALADLRYEIADTDNHTFRERLRARYAFLEAIRGRL